MIQILKSGKEWQKLCWFKKLEGKGLYCNANFQVDLYSVQDLISLFCNIQIFYTCDSFLLYAKAILHRHSFLLWPMQYLKAHCSPVNDRRTKDEFWGENVQYSEWMWSKEKNNNSVRCDKWIDGNTEKVSGPFRDSIINKNLLIQRAVWPIPFL